MKRTYGDTIDHQNEFGTRLSHYAPAEASTLAGGRDLPTAVRAADSYFVAADFLALVEQAAQTLPSGTQLEVEDFPSHDGWITFGQSREASAIGLPQGERGQGVLVQARINGLYWCRFVENVLPHVGLTIDMAGPTTVGGFVVHLGAERSDCICHEKVDDDSWETWFKALWLLLTQRTVSDDHTERIPRAARRRAERIGHSPHVRVIQLPRHQSASDGSSDVEWQHRWIVSGHWRQQPWGPERKRVRPVWIAPYVKGPEDKPLKDQAHRLFVTKPAE